MEAENPFGLVIYNEGLGLLELADTSLILINPSPSNVNHNTGCSLTWLQCHIVICLLYWQVLERKSKVLNMYSSMNDKNLLVRTKAVLVMFDK